MAMTAMIGWQSPIGHRIGPDHDRFSQDGDDGPHEEDGALLPGVEAILPNFIQFIDRTIVLYQ